MNKILWIDDEPKRFSKLSELEDIEVIFAHGREQIDYYLKASKINFDLIILDHDMPLMNGVDVCNEFLIEKNIQVILCSMNIYGAENQARILSQYDTDEYHYPYHQCCVSDSNFSKKINTFLRQINRRRAAKAS